MDDRTEPTGSGGVPAPDAFTIGAGESAARLKEWVWIAVTAAGLIIVYASPLGEYLRHVEELNSRIAAFGGWGPLIFVMAATLLTAMGFPRMVICPIGGMAFGFAWGLTWSVLGALIGAYITFCYARWAGKGLILRKWPQLEKVTGLFHRNSFLSIIMIRQLPNPGVLTNLFFGISPVRHRAFLFGSLIGYMPSAIPATLIGSSTIQPGAHGKAWYAGIAIVTIAILWLVSTLAIRRSSRFRSRPHTANGQ